MAKSPKKKKSGGFNVEPSKLGPETTERVKKRTEQEKKARSNSAKKAAATRARNAEASGNGPLKKLLSKEDQAMLKKKNRRAK